MSTAGIMTWAALLCGAALTSFSCANEPSQTASAVVGDPPQATDAQNLSAADSAPAFVVRARLTQHSSGRPSDSAAYSFALDQRLTESTWPESEGWRLIGIEFVPPRPGKLLLKVVDARWNDLITGTKIDVSQEGALLVVAARGLASDDRPGKGEVKLCAVRAAGVEVLHRSTVPAENMPKNMDAVPQGWSRSASCSYAIEVKEDRVLDGWSWNGGNSFSIAAARNEPNGVSNIPIAMPKEIAALPVGKWPEPVWAIIGRFTD